MTFNQPRPDSESNGYKSTDYDNLSDEQLDTLLRQCKVNVGPMRVPTPKRHVDLDALLGTQ
jgi:hypothetical protein